MSVFYQLYPSSAILVNNTQFTPTLYNKEESQSIMLLIYIR